MEVGDLVKLTAIVSDDYMKLRGIIFNIYMCPRQNSKKASVLWTDGDKTQEYPVDLEVVSCK